MTGPNETLALPLAVLNPMAKRHVATRLEQLLELDAEAHAAVLAQANARLDVPESLELGLVVADDVAGGWTKLGLSANAGYSLALDDASRGSEAGSSSSVS